VHHWRVHPRCMRPGQISLKRARRTEQVQRKWQCGKNAERQNCDSTAFCFVCPTPHVLFPLCLITALLAWPAQPSKDMLLRAPAEAECGMRHCRSTPLMAAAAHLGNALAGELCHSPHEVGRRG